MYSDCGYSLGRIRGIVVWVRTVYHSCEGLGCYLGDKQVIYDFPIKNSSKTLRVWYARRVANEESKKNYGISQDDPDYSNTIDQMVNTLNIN